MSLEPSKGDSCEVWPHMSNQGPAPLQMMFHVKPPGSPKSSVSMKTDSSMEPPIAFKDYNIQEEGVSTVASACVTGKSAQSREPPIIFKNGRTSFEDIVDKNNLEFLPDGAAAHHQTDLDATFSLLEQHMITFLSNELKRLKKMVAPVEPRCSEKEEEEGSEEAREDWRSCGKAFLTIALHFLRRMKQDVLADSLQNKHPARCQEELRSGMKGKFQYLFEGIAKAGKPTLLNDIFTELYLTDGSTAEINEKHEVRHIEQANRKAARPETVIGSRDIFKLLRDPPIRTVLTKGVAGIGKTVLTQKFMLDWAEDKANQDIQFIFPFTFRELNVLKEKRLSLMELVHLFFFETKRATVHGFEDFRVVFILDGLDECRLPLDFHRAEILTDVTAPTSVAVLLTNLIRGKLFPSARLWITTRPAAANQIPPECVDLVTEIRGFTDPQKEEYFRKRFRNEERAGGVIGHIKRSQSLHVMCHVPVFCWIMATVLEEVLKNSGEGVELPKTLTEMYIHFLVVQAKLSNMKYHGGDVREPHWNPDTRKMILSLGKLAFEQLQKGNLIFYESDLTECGIDIRAASVYSGVFTQIFREEQGLYQDMVFCFVHLSVQEFLAALYVDLTFSTSGRMLLLPSVEEEDSTLHTPDQLTDKYQLFYQSAVEQALQSPNGHLDLFLRFLLGLSLEANQNLLRGLLPLGGSDSRNCRATADFIKDQIKDSPSPEKSINLFHCLNELRDHLLVEQIQHFLSSERLSTVELSPAQWSALVFILLTSGECLEEFDLKKYCASEEALLHLLPVIKASQKALLSGCNLQHRSVDALVTVLGSDSGCLRELDLSDNDLQDAGVKLLAAGLKSPHCKLEILRLSGCLVTSEGCEYLALALSSNPSHLKELDLSYNHPGDKGVKLLSAGLQDPRWRLDTLRIDHIGEEWLKPGLKKYACELTLDPNTACRYVFLSDDNKNAAVGRENLLYPDHPHRFEALFAVICAQGLTGRCYWEVEREGWLSIGVMYKGMRRKGEGNECRLGRNDQSWALFASDDSMSVWHNDRPKTMYGLQHSLPQTVAVYLDWQGGTLSFYKVASDSMVHIHTFHARFTEPLYPGFGFRSGSAVRLCRLARS